MRSREGKAFLCLTEAVICAILRIIIEVRRAHMKLCRTMMMDMCMYKMCMCMRQRASGSSFDRVG